MKILHVTKKYPAALGGDSVVVSNLEKLQRARDHKIAVLTSNCDEILDGSHVYKFGLKDVPASLDRITIKRLTSLAALIFRAFKIIGRERPDVIHSHSVDMGFAVSFAARFYRVPIVHTFHIVSFYDKSQPAMRRRTELMLARGIKAAVITAPDIYDVRSLRQAGLSQTTLLPNGIDLEFWKKHGNVRKADTFTFVTVGRLEAQKGIEYLVRAAAILRDSSGTEFRIRIVGEGSLECELKDLVTSLGLWDFMQFEGRRSPVEVRSILGSSHVAIFPSLFEAMPITLLEAWAMGLPVITTPVGLFNGDESDTNLVTLVPPRSVEPLADAMADHLRDPAIRARQAEMAQERVKDYEWSRIGSIAEDLYNSQLARLS